MIVVLDLAAPIEAGRTSVDEARDRVKAAIVRLLIARSDLLRVDPRGAAELEVELWRELLGAGGEA